MQLISAADLEPRAEAPPLDDARCSARFTFAGVQVELRSDRPALVHAVEEKYAYHRSDAEPDFTYFALCDSQSAAFWCDHDGGWGWSRGPLPVDALAFLLDAALMSAVVRFKPSLRSIHAAAIEVDGKAAALAADSNGGKTTTLLACARDGMRVYSDERTLFDDRDLVHPFVRRCHVRSGSRTLLLQDRRDDRLGAALRDANDIDLVACFGYAAIATPAPLRALFVLRKTGERARVDKLDATAALPAVTRWFDMNGTVLDRLCTAVTLVRDLHCYAVTLGPPHETARVLRHTLEALP